MSKQLSVSAAFSILAMAAFALSANMGGAAELRPGLAASPAGIESSGWLKAQHISKASLLGD